MHRIIDYCKQLHMFTSGEGVIVGLSGGADSVCLLRVLLMLREELDLKLLAVHVHHGIRGKDADVDAAFCKALCDSYHVEFYQENADVPALSRTLSMSEEETGRKIRYDCFYRLLSHYGYQKIAVAHHQNDLAETMLFHMARGTGLHGLTAIRPVTGKLVRPLLCVSREEIQEILSRLNQEYCLDATNGDTRYTRNFIRHEIIGRMEKVNEKAVVHMAELSERLDVMQDYLRSCVSDAYHVCTTASEQGLSVSIELLQKQHLYIRQEVIRRCIFEMADGLKDIQAVHIKDILQLSERQTGKKIDLPHGIIVRREYERLFFERKDACQEQGIPDSENWELVIDMAQGQLPKEYMLPGKQKLTAELVNKISDIDGKKRYTKYFDCDKIKNTLVIRYPVADDYLVINAMGQRKPLRRYFIDAKIPTRIRGSIPVLAEGHHILWIPGYRISEKYKVTEDTDRILKLSLKRGDTNDRED